jgi:hypothetical protein
LLHYFLKHPHFCFRPYCVGRPVVAFILAVVCNASVVSSQTITVILAVACCWRHCCIPAVAGISADAGVPLVPDVLIVAGLPVIVLSLCSLS